LCLAKIREDTTRQRQPQEKTTKQDKITTRKYKTRQPQDKTTTRQDLRGECEGEKGLRGEDETGQPQEKHRTTTGQGKARRDTISPNKTRKDKHD
jgi:hypothetical protein